MKLPKSWQKLLREHQQQIKINNIDVSASKKEKPFKRTLALVFKIPLKTSKDIRKSLGEKIPINVKEAIFFPPLEGYHFSIQWTWEDNIHNLDLEKFKKELRKVFKETQEIKGSLWFPFFGKAGHFGIFLTDSEKEVFGIRQRLDQLFRSFNLPVGVKSIYYDLTYASLTRYRQRFLPEQIVALNKIKPQKIANITLLKVFLVLNDRFMTLKNTKFLATFKLGFK